MCAPSLQEHCKVIDKVQAMQQEPHQGEDSDLEWCQIQIGVITGSGTAYGAYYVGCGRQRKLGRSILDQLN